jgi:hypothetical protein
MEKSSDEGDGNARDRVLTQRGCCRGKFFGTHTSGYDVCWARLRIVRRSCSVASIVRKVDAVRLSAVPGLALRSLSFDAVRPLEEVLA